MEDLGKAGKAAVVEFKPTGKMDSQVTDKLGLLGRLV